MSTDLTLAVAAARDAGDAVGVELTRDDIQLLLAAAAPLIEAATRAQIAAETAEEAEVSHLDGTVTEGQRTAFTTGIQYAAWCIARGGAQ